MLGVRAVGFVAAFGAALADTLGTEVGHAVRAAARLADLLSRRPRRHARRGLDCRERPRAFSGRPPIALGGWRLGLIPMSLVLARPRSADFSALWRRACVAAMGRRFLFRLDHEFANAFNTLRRRDARAAVRRPGLLVKHYLRLARPFTLLPPLLGIVSGAVCAFGSAHNPDPARRVTWAVVLTVAIGSLCASAMNAASNIVNQIADLEIDRKNKPDRPLVTGEVGDPAGAGVAAVPLRSSRSCRPGSSFRIPTRASRSG